MDAGLLGSGILFLTLATIMFALRVYVRAFLIRKWGLDDWLITCAMVAFVVYSGCQITGIIYGIGRHLDELSTANAKNALMLWWLCEIFYIPSTVFLKLSVGVFLHRLAINRYHIWIIRFMTLASGLFGTAYLLLAIFQCRPTNAWWIQKHAPPESKSYGWCFSNPTVVAVTFVSCSLNAVADCTFGIIPIFMVKDLQMPWKQKRLVACILGFANIACVATIVRTPFTIKFFKDNDFLYETRTFALLSTIEPGVGIAAVCTATLRPLLQSVLGVSSSGWFSVQRVPGDNGKTGGSYTLSDSPANFPTDHSSNYVEITAGWRPPSRAQKKAPTITGKEMKYLYANSVLSDDISSADPAFTDPGSRITGEPIPSIELAFTQDGTETVRTGNTVGYTFFEDGDDGSDETRSSAEKPLPALPVANESKKRLSHEPATPSRRQKQPDDPYSPSHRYQKTGFDRSPGSVGDPFGAWRER